MMSLKVKLVAVASTIALVSVFPAWAQMPKISGKPVIDTPKILEWPLDNGVTQPNLHNPTSNVLYDLHHGKVNSCDLVLSTEVNYHMALHDI